MSSIKFYPQVSWYLMIIVDAPSFHGFCLLTNCVCLGLIHVDPLISYTSFQRGLTIPQFFCLFAFCFFFLKLALSKDILKPLCPAQRFKTRGESSTSSGQILTSSRTSHKSTKVRDWSINSLWSCFQFRIYFPDIYKFQLWVKVTIIS